MLRSPTLVSAGDICASAGARAALPTTPDCAEGALTSPVSGFFCE
jgi:hypothetical protein